MEEMWPNFQQRKEILPFGMHSYISIQGWNKRQCVKGSDWKIAKFDREFKNS